MTGWPTAPACSMSSSSALTMLSSATDAEEPACRVLASWATTALARCIGVKDCSGLDDWRGAGDCSGVADRSGG